MAFRLCIAMGVKHPDLLLRQLTSRQIAEWNAYYRLEPFGHDYTNILLARIAYEIANRWRGKDEQPHDLLDFLPGRRPPSMEPDAIKRSLRSFLDGCRKNS